MSNLTLKQSLKKKSILLTFLIACSLLISENALARYGIEDCSVGVTIGEKCIEIYFKFFEYQTRQGGKCSYIKDFKILYLKDGVVRYDHLMTAWSEEQTSNTWAWIECNNKKCGEKIKHHMNPHDRNTNSGGPFRWKDDTKKRYEVAAASQSKEIYFGVQWYPKHDVTNIQIKLKWYNYMSNKTEDVTLDYEGSMAIQKWKAKNLSFSNSSPKQEISYKEKKNSIKLYKEANAIVIEGALDEKIQVRTTIGVLVKSMVANSEVFQIPVPANQLYIVNVGQDSYKVAL